MYIRKSEEADFAVMLAIINDAALAYRGVIPSDRWHEPYMPREELEGEISRAVVFWVAEREGRELVRREQAYRGGRPVPDLEGRKVILVDDGLATGASMRAAIRALGTIGGRV